MNDVVEWEIEDAEQSRRHQMCYGIEQPVPSPLSKCFSSSTYEDSEMDSEDEVLGSYEEQLEEEAEGMTEYDILIKIIQIALLKLYDLQCATRGGTCVLGGLRRRAQNMHILRYAIWRRVLRLRELGVQIQRQDFSGSGTELPACRTDFLDFKAVLREELERNDLWKVLKVSAVPGDPIPQHNMSGSSGSSADELVTLVTSGMESDDGEYKQIYEIPRIAFNPGERKRRK